MKRLEPISKLLDKRSKGRLAGPIAASVILDKFKTICNENLPAEVNKGKQIISYKDKAIKIKCDNQIIAQEIKLKEVNLIEALNKEVDVEIVNKLSFC